jgi:hypothetical protein
MMHGQTNIKSPCIWLYVCTNRNISLSYSITLCMAVSTNRDIALSSWITLYLAVSTNRGNALSSWITLYLAVSTNRDINLYMAVSTNRGSSVFIFCQAFLLAAFLLRSLWSQMAREHIQNIMHSHIHYYATLEVRKRITFCQFFSVTSMHCVPQMCHATILWGGKNLQRITRFINKQDMNCVFCLLCNSQ